MFSSLEIYERLGNQLIALNVIDSQCEGISRRDVCLGAAAFCAYLT